MYHIDFLKMPFSGSYSFQELKQQTIDEHDHAFYEIAIILSGQGWHASGNQLLRARERDVFVIPIGTPHGWIRNSQMQLLNIYYKASSSSCLTDQASALQPVFFAGDLSLSRLRSAIHMRITPETLSEIRRELHQSRQNEDLGDTYRLSCFLKVLAYLQRDYGNYYGIRDVASQELRPTIYRLMEVLDQYALMGASFNLPAEAARQGISPEHATRLFRQALKISPYKFFNNRRLLHAEAMLRSSDKSCTEIAHELGFADSAHFSRTFRESHGVTPMNWRKQH